MDIFGLSMESDVVEELALKMYDELEKIICDNDPMMFSNLIFLISNTLEQLNNRIVREKELCEKMQVMRDENEELLMKFRNRGKIIEDKDRIILQYQSEIEAFHHEKELLTNDSRIMKKKIIDLNKKIKELERVVDSFESENYFKEEKLKAMEKELETKFISHRNNTLKINCQKNLFNNNNSEEKPVNLFAVLKRHINNIDENLNNKLELSSSADIQLDSAKSTPTSESTPTEVSSNSELEPIKLNQNLDVNIRIFSDATGKELSLLLKKHFSNNCNIMSLVKSNATFLQVVNSCRPESYTENDHVILIFGVTDIDLRKECEIFMKLESYLALFNRTNVWICTLPYRYDLDPDDTKQNIIQLINNYMKEISVRLTHVRVIDIYGFKQNNFSRDGVYLNAKGKKKLSGLIHKSIKMR